MKESLLHQFSGFVETPQVWDRVASFPYPPYELCKVRLQKEPSDLHLPPTMVLGKRMEQFFKYYVTHFSREEILAHNEQVIHKKHTLGELDFLLKDQKTQQVSHVELVYKFYLYDPEISAEGDRWTGPNHRDSLNRKINRLLNQQFPLLHRKETLPLLERLGVASEEITQKICFKANFFYPWDHTKPESFLNFQEGWIRASKFEGSFFHSGSFFSPKKPDWPILPHHNETWYSYKEIKEQTEKLLEKEQSPLIWMKTSNGQYLRFFIVWW